MPAPGRTNAICARSAARSLAATEQVGNEAQQSRHRQAHDVPVVALDLLDESRSATLDGVGAGPLAPLPGGQVPSQIRLLEAAEADLRDGHVAALGAVGLAQRDAGHHLVRAPGQAAQEDLGLRLVARLAEGVAVEDNGGVGAEDALGGWNRAGLSQRVLPHQRPRVAPGELLHLRRLHPEGDSELLEDLTSLRRARGKNHSGAGRARPLVHGEDQSSGKKRPISRAEDSAESEPCTRLVWTSSPNSPRIEPGAASSGFVAPITWRAAVTASWPSSTSATSGPPVMKSTRSPKKGRSACSAECRSARSRSTVMC